MTDRAFTYRVRTVTFATIRETWTIDSQVPLSTSDVDRLIGTGDLIDVIRTHATAAGLAVTAVTCDEDATRIEEGNRIVTAIADAPALEACDPTADHAH